MHSSLCCGATSTQRYCEIDAYCAPYQNWVDTVDGETYDVKVCFQMRVLPGSYSVGQNTTAERGKIDPWYNNSEVEWYTKGDVKGSLIITGLLLKMTKLSYVDRRMRSIEETF